jgi:DNA-binding beta-propeller fold protein YncE
MIRRMRKTNTTLTLACAWALTILFASAARGETRAATAPSRCNDALVGTVPVGTSPVGVAVANEGKLVLVTNSNRFSKERTGRQTLTVIDASKVGAGASAIMGSVQAGAFPREFGASPDGRTLFVAHYNTNELEVIDLARLPLTQK